MAYGPMSTPRRPAPRSMGTPMMPTALPVGGALTCAVVIKPAVRLTTEISRRHHLTQQRWRREARVFELVEQDVGDIQHRIQPDEVEQLERTHRVAGAEHHADVDVL